MVWMEGEGHTTSMSLMMTDNVLDLGGGHQRLDLFCIRMPLRTVQVVGLKSTKRK